MAKLNHAVLHSNFKQALKELEGLVRKLEGAGQPSEAELQVGIDHVYHHLNFAWNARRMGNKRAFGCSDEDFNRWSRFPRGINFSRVEGTQGRGANSRRLAHSWMRG